MTHVYAVAKPIQQSMLDAIESVMEAGGTFHQGAIVTNNTKTKPEPEYQTPEERQKAQRLADLKKYKENIKINK